MYLTFLEICNIIENEQLLNPSENNEELGNENIYLSGGQGIITKLDLFSWRNGK